MRAACVRAAAPAATAGLSPVEIFFALTPLPPLSSWAAEAIPAGPVDDEIEKDVDRLDSERPPRKPPPPLLLLPSAMSVAGRGTEGGEASSEGTNAGGERRYRSGANAADSLNARRHTCEKWGGARERRVGRWLMRHGKRHNWHTESGSDKAHFHDKTYTGIYLVTVDSSSSRLACQSSGAARATRCGCGPHLPYLTSKSCVRSFKSHRS